jgi:hypothetical protein
MITCAVPVLDANLTTEQAEAVNIALALETNAKDLRSFAATLTPSFPIAAALLAIKANLMGENADECRRAPL